MFGSLRVCLGSFGSVGFMGVFLRFFGVVFGFASFSFSMSFEYPGFGQGKLSYLRIEIFNIQSFLFRFWR